MKKLKRVVIKEELIALTGDPIKAIILNQMLYWTEIIYESDQDKINRIEVLLKLGESEQAAKLRNELRDGWFWKSVDEMHEEIMISSRATVGRRMKELVEEEYVFMAKNPNAKWDKTNRYRANIEFIQDKLIEKGYALEGYPLSTKLFTGLYIPPKR